MTNQTGEREALSRRELDAAIAERVMGWRHKSNGMMHGKVQQVFIDDRDNTHSIHCGCAEDFNPSESIEDAWEIVEHFQKLGYMVSVNASGTGGYWCCMYPPHAGGFIESDTVTTAPEAICRAALAAVNTQYKEQP
jgi:hypothetical protein